MPTCPECECADKVAVSNLMQTWVCLRCRIWWRADKFGGLENSHNNHDARQYTAGGLTIRSVLPATAAKENQPQALAQKDYYKK